MNLLQTIVQNTEAIFNPALLVGLLFAAFMFAVPAIGHAASWYVDNTVRSSGDGTSWSNAWNNSSDIRWSNIQPGDTIYISGGQTSKRYTGSLVVGASGTVDKPIVITRSTDPEHNGTPILAGEPAFPVSSPRFLS